MAEPVNEQHAEPSGGLLVHFLADRDEPCPSCGYNLRDLRSAACPECGQPLNVRLDATDPRTGRYLACVIALGGDTSVMTTILAVAIPGLRGRPLSLWNPGDQFLFVWYPVVVGVVAGMSLVLLVRRRGRAWFHGGSDRARTMFAVVCVLVSLASVVAWTMWFHRTMFS